MVKTTLEPANTHLKGEGDFFCSCRADSIINSRTGLAGWQLVRSTSRERRCQPPSLYSTDTHVHTCVYTHVTAHDRARVLADDGRCCAIISFSKLRVSGGAMPPPVHYGHPCNVATAASFGRCKAAERISSTSAALRSTHIETSTLDEGRPLLAASSAQRGLCIN